VTYTGIKVAAILKCRTALDHLIISNLEFYIFNIGNGSSDRFANGTACLTAD